ncbi:MAG: inorganic phosphate transporter [Candidatus Aenigmatarchaeota archaeon]
MLIFIAIAMALYMAWSIGANDSANSLGVAVGSRVMSIRRAIVIGSLAGFIGAFFFSSPVINTIGKGIIESAWLNITAATIIFFITGTLLGLASWRGLPLSTTQTLIGVIIGYSLSIGARLNNVILGNIIISWVISPLFGIILGFVSCIILRVIVFSRIKSMLQKESIERRFATLQIFSVMLLALAYGANDIPNAVGILSEIELFLPLLFFASVAFILGIAMFGPKVIQTLGTKITSTELSSVHGFIIQAVAGFIVLVFTIFGMPVSTTHITVGTIMGVGLGNGLGWAGIRWRTMAEILFSWIFIIPIGAFAGWAITSIMLR